jgi:hypothetical protein
MFGTDCQLERSNVLRVHDTLQQLAAFNFNNTSSMHPKPPHPLLVTARSVAGSVTTSESLVFYVLFTILFFSPSPFTVLIELTTH